MVHFLFHTDAITTPGSWLNPEVSIQGIAQWCFGLICHQDPSILMQIGGREFQLCPRCLGLHLGFSSSLLAIARRTGGRIRIAGKGARSILVLAIGAMVLHWFLGRLGVVTQDPVSRLATGLVCGSSMSFILAAYRHNLAYPLRRAGRSIAAVHMATQLFVLLIVNLAVVATSGLTVLSGIALLSVFFNAIVAVQTALLIFRTRLSSQTPAYHSQ